MNFLVNLMKFPYAIILTCLWFCPVLAIGGNMEVPVHVYPAKNIEIAPTMSVPGTVIGNYDSNISAELSGLIEQLVDVGDQVSQGGIIAKLDDKQIRLQLDEATAEILPIEARLDFYQKEAKRLEKLASQNNAAKNRLDEILSNRDEMLGELAIKKSQLARIHDRLERTRIVAPFEGVVSERFKSEGEWVEAGDEIIRLINLEILEVQARIPATSVPYIQMQDEIKVMNGRSEIITKVKTLVPVGDDVSRLYEIRLEAENPDWMIGQAVKVIIPIDFSRDVIAVPRDALVIRREGTVVYRINNKIAEVVHVETGISNDTLIEVIGDIQPGDEVVTRGNERLQPGQQTIIMDK